MKTTNKKSYITPLIECVKLDNEISLALASGPPEGPNETINNSVIYFNNEPFKVNKA